MKERQLDPYASPMHFLGAELRLRRRARGLTVASLARTVLVSSDLIGKVEKAVRTPGRDLITRCDKALDADGALQRIFDFATNVAASPVSCTRSRGRTEPVSLVIKVVTGTDYGSVAAVTVPGVRKGAHAVPRARAGTKRDGSRAPTPTSDERP